MVTDTSSWKMQSFITPPMTTLRRRIPSLSDVIRQRKRFIDALQLRDFQMAHLNSGYRKRNYLVILMCKIDVRFPWPQFGAPETTHTRIITTVGWFRSKLCIFDPRMTMMQWRNQLRIIRPVRTPQRRAVKMVSTFGNYRKTSSTWWIATAWDHVLTNRNRAWLTQDLWCLRRLKMAEVVTKQPAEKVGRHKTWYSLLTKSK